ncbi:hypothetical protein SUGI_1203260 [Cryptomeria japonica]|nr:hypothetical protein SUGI_1203260 [Cryptomeria japonica]
MTGPIISNSSPSQDYVVYGLNVPAVENEHNYFGDESGSQNTNGLKNGLMSSCDMITQETENKKHQDEWLKLSLKISQGTRLGVEGFSKDDLKLSLPDAKECFNGSNCFDSLESHIEELKQVGPNVCSMHPCNIYYPNRCPRTDTSSCHQPREKNCLEVQNTMICMTDLNLPPNTTDVFSVVNTSASLRLDSYCSCYNTHRREKSQSAALNQISTQGYSVYKESGFDRPAVLPDQRMTGSINHITIPCDGLFKDLHQGGANFKESNIFRAPKYKFFKNESVPFSGNNEVVANQIDCDSENACSKQNTIQISPRQHNSVGTCEKGSAPEEILANHDMVLSHGNYLKGNLRQGNVVGTGSTNKTDDDTNIVQLHYSRSTEYLAQHSGLDAQWPADNNIIVDLSSSGNECINITPGDTLQPASPLKDGGEYRPEGDVQGKELENDIVDKKNAVSSVSVDNHKSVHNVKEGGSVGTCGLQEINLPCKCPSTHNGGDHPIVYSMKTNLSASEHNLMNSQLRSSKHSSHDPQEAEANRNFQMWDRNIICDLCGQGPSLMYGEWYAWCCGLRSRYCKCSEEHKRKLLKSMEHKKAKSLHKWKGYQWSGKVHRMCGLWSSEVFEKDDTRDQFEGLLVAVRRARSFVCAECKRFGATLGCGAKTCKKIYHYPCADWLSTKLCCRMWEGFRSPVFCYYHIYADDYHLTAKDRKIHANMKYINNPDLNGTIREKIAHQKITVKDDPDVKNQDVTKAIADNVDVAVSWELSSFLKMKTEVDSTISNQGFSDKATPSRITYGGIKYLGQNLICEDISNGTEMIKIPCTNDRDNVSIPKFHYIPTNRFSTKSNIILERVKSDMEKQAKACDGCDEFDMDDPEAGISIHVHQCIRDQDDRIDWQGEPMLGRLAYDRYGRLQLGPGTPDVVECNTRCPCGSKCLNRKLQYGFRVRLEVFRTPDRRWGLRVLEQIPRGRFVVEYVGEVLSPEEAIERENIDDNYNARYLFSMDHPSVPPKDQLVVDIFGMSNVVRFINHSSEGNLSIYRVYTETVDPKIYRLGLYACRDIEAGEELTYDYKIPMIEY